MDHPWIQTVGLNLTPTRRKIRGIITCKKSYFTGDLAERLKDYEWYGVPRMSGKTGEMTPILYRKNRFMLLGSGTFWYSETPDVPESKSWDAFYPRIASWVKLRDFASGREFFFFNTHFDHRGEIARQKSGEIIRQKIKEIAGSHPAILTGDFNTREGSEAYGNIVKDSTLRDAGYSGLY